MLCANNLIIVL